MYIKRVQITGFRDDAPEGARSGSVALVCDDRCVHIPLTTPRRVEILKSRHRLRLLAMALKRARAMPEYHEGDEIRFAPGILPFGLTEVDLTPPARRRKSG